jgi:hypothetical protein
MARSGIQFQKGLSLPLFQRFYGTEDQCEAALEKARWPDGFRQRGQDLLLLEPGLFGQRFAGLLQGVRLATHPLAISQAVFSLKAQLQFNPARQRVLAEIRGGPSLGRC